ncbi:MAG: hypothetical protein ACKOJI_05290, partial [Phycisphaerales bacterium]
PPLQINCRPGGLAIDGIRIRDGDMFVAWARGGRQWLFDTQAGQVGTPPGRGVISADERTPRYAFARSTGTASVDRVVQDVFVGGVQETQGRTGDIMSLESPPDRAYDGTAQYLRWPTAMQYFNLWGEPRRGKPTFLPTRIPEFNGRRMYAYPAWRIAPGTTLSSLGIGNIHYGEKGGTDARFVDGTDHRNFVAPMRLFQKDADFDHVAEILDVPMWGPLVAMDATGRTYATLPEILAQPASSRGTASVFFPKFVQQAPMTGLQLPDFGPDQVGFNRLRLEPAQFDTVANANNRPNMLSGVQVLPPVFDPADTATANLARQNGSGFNSRLPGGIVLLDAVTDADAVDRQPAGAAVDLEGRRQRSAGPGRQQAGDAVDEALPVLAALRGVELVLEAVHHGPRGCTAQARVDRPAQLDEGVVRRRAAEVLRRRPPVHAGARVEAGVRQGPGGVEVQRAAARELRLEGVGAEGRPAPRGLEDGVRIPHERLAGLRVIGQARLGAADDAVAVGLDRCGVVVVVEPRLARARGAVRAGLPTTTTFSAPPRARAAAA